MDDRLSPGGLLPKLLLRLIRESEGHLSFCKKMFLNNTKYNNIF